MSPSFHPHSYSALSKELLPINRRFRLNSKLEKYLGRQETERSRMVEIQSAHWSVRFGCTLGTLVKARLASRISVRVLVSRNVVPEVVCSNETVLQEGV